MQQSEEIRAKLTSMYEDLEKEILALGAKCYGCGQCCNFKTNGMQLYAQDLESDLILEETGVSPFLKLEGNCNFQENNMCTIHQIRPLGCRTYFQEAKDSVEHQELYEKYHLKIKEISQEFDVDYGFGPFFGDAK